MCCSRPRADPPQAPLPADTVPAFAASTNSNVRPYPVRHGAGPALLARRQVLTRLAWLPASLCNTSRTACGWRSPTEEREAGYEILPNAMYQFHDTLMPYVERLIRSQRNYVACVAFVYAKDWITVGVIRGAHSP